MWSGNQRRLRRPSARQARDFFASRRDLKIDCTPETTLLATELEVEQRAVIRFRVLVDQWRRLYTVAPRGRRYSDLLHTQVGKVYVTGSIPLFAELLELSRIGLEQERDLVETLAIQRFSQLGGGDGRDEWEHHLVLGMLFSAYVSGIEMDGLLGRYWDAMSESYGLAGWETFRRPGLALFEAHEHERQEEAEKAKRPEES